MWNKNAQVRKKSTNMTWMFLPKVFCLQTDFWLVSRVVVWPPQQGWRLSTGDKRHKKRTYMCKSDQSFNQDDWSKTDPFCRSISSFFALFMSSWHAPPPGAEAKLHPPARQVKGQGALTTNIPLFNLYFLIFLFLLKKSVILWMVFYICKVLAWIYLHI